jgi:hypothetical protein
MAFERAFGMGNCFYILCRRFQEQTASVKHSRARQDACRKVKNGREGYENFLGLSDTYLSI